MANKQSLKHLSFVMLVVQNTALGIVSKYSRLNKGPKYYPGTVVMLVEMLKFFLCFLVLLQAKKWRLRSAFNCLRDEVFADFQGIKKMVILAVLYAAQNMVALLAYDYVDVATYQIVYQLKIITTAICMMFLLNRRFSSVQWGAMVTLMIGVVVCSYSRLPTTPTSTSNNAVTKKPNAHDNKLIGVLIVFGLAVNSGLAAAYFERVLKTHKAGQVGQSIDPLYTRNLQLSAVSIAVTISDLVRNYSTIAQNGFFGGFHTAVWTVVVLQAVGGLTIAAVVRYSDNVVKNFGTSFSLIFSCIISNYMFKQTSGFGFYIGVILVVVSVFIYGDQRFAVKEKPRSEIPATTHELSSVETKRVPDHRISHHGIAHPRATVPLSVMTQ